jgi:hypothetical protein
VADYQKLTINIHPDIHAQLQALSEAQGTTITDSVKRALALYKFAWEHRDGELLIKEGGTIKHIVLLW